MSRRSRLLNSVFCSKHLSSAYDARKAAQLQAGFTIPVIYPNNRKPFDHEEYNLDSRTRFPRHFSRLANHFDGGEYLMMMGA
jgi:hypothetical protein